MFFHCAWESLIFPFLPSLSTFYKSSNCIGTENHLIILICISLITVKVEHFLTCYLLIIFLPFYWFYLSVLCLFSVRIIIFILLIVRTLTKLAQLTLCLKCGKYCPGFVFFVFEDSSECLLMKRNFQVLHTFSSFIIFATRN